MQRAFNVSDAAEAERVSIDGEATLPTQRRLEDDFGQRACHSRPDHAAEPSCVAKVASPEKLTCEECGEPAERTYLGILCDYHSLCCLLARHAPYPTKHCYCLACRFYDAFGWGTKPQKELVMEWVRS